MVNAAISVALLHVFKVNITQTLLMMIIVPNSHAHKGEKEKGDVKGEYGGI